jgi:hypothetical protein
MSATTRYILTVDVGYGETTQHAIESSLSPEAILADIEACRRARRAYHGVGFSDCDSVSIQRLDDFWLQLDRIHA